MEANPPLLFPNGIVRTGLEVTTSGDVIALCADGVMRQLHPALVAALGSGVIAPGVWQVATARMQNPAAPALFIPPDALRRG